MHEDITDIERARPVFIFFGGMVQIFGAVGEWILGNTFSCALFFTYGIVPIAPALVMTRQ